MGASTPAGPPRKPDGKRTIAIIGGGPSALSAAFELTATPELRERHHVIVFQPGWRLGGKGASGRNAAFFDRIEEHGLHIWFGCYDNAFTFMQRCYAELDRPRGAPLRTWDEAFRPCDHVVLYECWCEQRAGWTPDHPFEQRPDHERWVSHDLHFVRNPLPVGHEHDRTLGEILRAGAGWVASEWELLRGAHPSLEEAVGAAPAPTEHPHGILGRIAAAVEHAVAHALNDVEEDAIHVTGALLRDFRDWLARHVMPGRWDHDELRLLYGAVDLLGTLAIGMAKDRVVERGFGEINELELTAWLRGHGAQDVTLRTSPILRGAYDGAFAYEDGDKDKPNTAAGKGVQDFIRAVFLYKGSIVWKMQAGMGDTVFAPLHDVLGRRGVDIRYFHAVARVGVDGDQIGEFDVVEQAHVRDEKPYHPLVPVRDLPCWPSEPDWSQLAEGEELHALWDRDRYAADPEHVLDPLGMGAVPWRRGEQFDDVILAVPPDVQNLIAGELRVDDDYDAMLNTTKTVITQAFQLWLDRSLGPEGLDWPYPGNSIMSSYVEPLDTYCNMNQLICREQWPQDDELLDVAYFCGVIPARDCPTPQAGDERARTNAITFLDTAAKGFWPRSEDEGGRVFDWGLLVDPAGGSGTERFAAQYWRANVQPAERYVLTPAGSIRFRLPADGTRFTNLFLCGDWTRNGLDAGCIEASVTSGMLASRAICGFPEHVAGTASWLSRD